MKLKYIRELDGVRGVAAIMIIIFHFFQVLQVSSQDHLLLNFQKISRFGQTGVTLFFVLSGFLITRILIYTKNSPNYFSSFYVRRSLRIFPLYYFFLVLSFYVIPNLTKENFVSFNNQIYYWIYLQNFAMTFSKLRVGPGQLWSLAVEEHFYLFWPLLIYYLELKHIKFAIYLIFILALLSRVILFSAGYGSFYFTFSNIDALAIGSLLAVNELKGINKRYYGSVFIAIVIPTIILWVFVGGKGNDIVQILKLPLNAVTYYGLIGFVVATAGASGFFNKVLLFKPLNYTGKISYGLYVYHPMVFYLFHKYTHFTSIALNLILASLLSYIVATISYYGFEARILQLKKYFEYSGKLKTATEV